MFLTLKWTGLMLTSLYLFNLGPALTVPFDFKKRKDCGIWNFEYQR